MTRFTSGRRGALYAGLVLGASVCVALSANAATAQSETSVLE